jgi:3'-phosphoadenosine 5'-phosphosulfate sulfotransferase (PAPS reductase)/FAD synthetase
VVTYETASRKGEPFEALIDKRGLLPNPVARFCTQELKIGAMRRWAATVGLRGADNVIGLRADEPSRVAKMRGARNGYDVLMPLATAGITKRDVMEFWMSQNFDLRLPNIGGTTPAGNCDLCFLKNTATIQGLIRRSSEGAIADWWIAQEAKIGRASTPSAKVFRADRPSYQQLKDAVLNQRDFDFGDEEIIDCFCGDAA